MVETGKKLFVMGAIIILTSMSIAPLEASVSPRSQQNTTGKNSYVLCEITVKQDYVHLGAFHVNVTWSNQSDFDFQNISDVNFTIITKHRLDDRVLIPRWTKYWVMIGQSEDPTWNIETHYYRCKTLTWEYHNITLNRGNMIYPPTNGTLWCMVSASGFPFKMSPIPYSVKLINITYTGPY
jgi:hypothetical protein